LNVQNVTEQSGKIVLEKQVVAANAIGVYYSWESITTVKILDKT